MSMFHAHGSILKKRRFEPVQKNTWLMSRSKTTRRMVYLHVLFFFTIHFFRVYIYIYSIYIYMSQDSIQCSQEKAALRMHVFHPSQACKWLSLQHLRFQLQPRHSSRRNASNQSTRCRATKEPVSIEMWLLHHS